MLKQLMTGWRLLGTTLLLVSGPGLGAALVLHSTMDNADVERAGTNPPPTLHTNDGNWTVLDLAGTAENGTAYSVNTGGWVTSSAAGAIGEAISFSDATGGNRQVNYGNVHNDTDGSFTVSLWINPNNTGLGARMIADDGNYSSGADGWSIWMENDDLRLRANHGIDGTERVGINNNNSLSAGTWSHVVAVFDANAAASGRTGRLIGYLDGQGSGISGTDNGWIVGTYGGGQTNQYDAGDTFDSPYDTKLGIRRDDQLEWPGQVDDFAMWDKPLSSGEVKALYDVSSLSYNAGHAQALFDAYSSQSSTAIGVDNRSWYYSTSLTGSSSTDGELVSTGGGNHELHLDSGSGVGLTTVAHLEWDGSDTGNAQADGGSGTWNAGASANWWNSFSDVPWPGTSSGDDQATFGVTGGTVTVAPGGVTANRLTFQTNGYMVTGGPLTLDGTTPTAAVANGGDTATIASPISGSAGLTKTGPGTLVLTGSNSFSGGITVSAGTLVGFAETLPDDIANSGAVVFNQAADGVYGHAVSGTGSLTKEGAGVLTLTNHNTHGGGTVITEGTLRLGGSALAGATLHLDAADATTVIRDGSGVVNQWQDLSGNGYHADRIGSTGNVTYTAGGLNGLPVVSFVDSGGADYLRAAGYAPGDAEDLTVLLVSRANAQTLNGSAIHPVVGAGNPSYGAGTFAISTMRPNAGGPGNLGYFGRNYNPFPYDEYTSNATLPNFSDGLGHVIGLTLSGATGTGTFTGYYDGGLTEGHGGSTSNPSNGPVEIGGSSSAGSRRFNGDIGELLIYSNSLSATDRQAVEAYLAAKWGLAIASPVAVDADNLPDAGSVLVDGGALDIGNFNETVGAVTLRNGSIDGDLGTLTGSSYNVENGTISARLGGSAGLTKTTAGTVTLTGANTYTGPTSVNAGTLQLGDGGTTGSLADASNLDIAGGATFHFNRSSSDITFGNDISGTGTILKTRSSEFGLTGTNSFAGTIDIQQGKIAFAGAGSASGEPDVNVAPGATLSVGSGFVGGTAAIGNLTGGGLINTAFGGGAGVRTLQVDQTTNGTFSGQLTDAHSGRVLALTKAGPATLTLAGGFDDVSYSGETTVDAGTLRVGGSASSVRLFDQSSPRTIHVNSGGTLELVYRNAFGAVSPPSTPTTTIVIDGGTVTSANAVNILQDLTLRNGATLHAASPFNPWHTYQLQGTVTADGTSDSWITADTGEITVGKSGAAGAATTFDVAADRTLTVSAPIYDSGNTAGGSFPSALTKTGPGTLTLTEINSYTGMTAVDAGTLVIDGSVPGNVTVAPGAVLAGSGSAGGSVLVGGTVSPGSSPGTFTAGAQVWPGGGSYLWELNDADGLAGSDPGWDLLAVTNALDITATSSDPFVVDIQGLVSPGNTPGLPNGIVDLKGKWWTFMIAEADVVTGFSPDAFLLDASDFAPIGNWSIAATETGVFLTFTSTVPEPATAPLLALSLLCLGLAAARTRRSHAR